MTRKFEMKDTEMKQQIPSLQADLEEAINEKTTMLVKMNDLETQLQKWQRECEKTKVKKADYKKKFE